jgi:hypothetical protein
LFLIFIERWMSGQSEPNRRLADRRRPVRLECRRQSQLGCQLPPAESCRPGLLKRLRCLLTECWPRRYRLMACRLEQHRYRLTA